VLESRTNLITAGHGGDRPEGTRRRGRSRYHRWSGALLHSADQTQHGSATQINNPEHDSARWQYAPSGRPQGGAAAGGASAGAGEGNPMIASDLLSYGFGRPDLGGGTPARWCSRVIAPPTCALQLQRGRCGASFGFADCDGVICRAVAARLNSPAATPSTKAFHSAAVNLRWGASGRGVLGVANDDDLAVRQHGDPDISTPPHRRMTCVNVLTPSSSSGRGMSCSVSDGRAPAVRGHRPPSPGRGRSRAGGPWRWSTPAPWQPARS
jgi:hypothetical protein